MCDCDKKSNCHNNHDKLKNKFITLYSVTGNRNYLEIKKQIENITAKNDCLTATEFAKLTNYYNIERSKYT